MRTVSIFPAGEGWCVRSDEVDNDLFFLKGSAAETAALQLATAMAEQQDVRVEIYVRDGSLARRFTVPAIAANVVREPVAA